MRVPPCEQTILVFRGYHDNVQQRPLSFTPCTLRIRRFLGLIKNHRKTTLIGLLFPRNPGKGGSDARTVVGTSHRIIPKPIVGLFGVLLWRGTLKDGSKIGKLSDLPRIYSMVHGCWMSTTGLASGKDTKRFQRGSCDGILTTELCWKWSISSWHNTTAPVPIMAVTLMSG